MLWITYYMYKPLALLDTSIYTRIGTRRLYISIYRTEYIPVYVPVYIPYIDPYIYTHIWICIYTGSNMFHWIRIFPYMEPYIRVQVCSAGPVYIPVYWPVYIPCIWTCIYTRIYTRVWTRIYAFWSIFQIKSYSTENDKIACERCTVHHITEFAMCFISYVNLFFVI